MDSRPCLREGDNPLPTQGQALLGNDPDEIAAHLTGQASP
jgi:hypothetical protein